MSPFPNVSRKLTSLSNSPGILTDVEIVSFNDILLRASAFDMSHIFLYHKVYSYAVNVSAHLWMHLYINGVIVFVSPNNPNKGLLSVTVVKCQPYIIWRNFFTPYSTARPSLSIRKMENCQLVNKSQWSAEFC